MNKEKSGISIGISKGLFIGLNILAAFSLIASYAASYVSPAQSWIFAFFGLAYPFILLLNLFFVLLWLLTWKRYIWLSLLLILAGFSHILMLVQYRTQYEDHVKAGSVKVLTYNVHSLYEIPSSVKNYHKPKQRILSRVTDFLIRQNADILCIQEFFLRIEDSSKVMRKLTEGLNTKYCSIMNYNEIEDKRKIFAIATFSRFPIISMGHIRINGRNIFAIYTDLLCANDTIRVYNVHLESIRFGKSDYSFYAQLTDQTKEPDDKFYLSDGIGTIFSKLKKAFVIRASQVDALKADVARSPYPVIVCGDFNDTPGSYTYHQMTTGLHDAFCESGSGFLGSTYAGNFPSFRIDYILYNDHFTGYNYRKSDVSLSDHYPVQVFLDRKN